LTIEGENSGVLGLSLEVVLLFGVEKGEGIDCVGLNTGAEGLSLVLGGEHSGVVGLIDELLLSLSLGVLGGAGFCCSKLLSFPSIREGAEWVELATSAGFLPSSASSN
jgi:hypothetical protein